MSATHASIEDQYEPGLYEIRIKGHLDNRWAVWLVVKGFQPSPITTGMTATSDVTPAN